MTASDSDLLLDVLEEHLEDLQFLWAQRGLALRSADYSFHDLAELDDRIESHVAGLLVAEDNLMSVVEPALADKDANVTFAGSYPLLRQNRDTAAFRVVRVLLTATDGQLQGTQQALSHGPIGAIAKDLTRAAATAPATVALAASEALAFHSFPGTDVKRFEEFLSDENPDVRRAAWRLLGQTGLVRNQQWFEAGVRDGDAAVRREAHWAAAWTRQQWLLSYLRSVASNPSRDNWEAILLLAILGKPEDLQRIQTAGTRVESGPKRFQILGAYGHPELVEELIRGMASTDLRSAVAAGAAFTKITGCNVESDKRVQLPPEDGSEPDEFEKEFLDEAKLPDVQKARDHWAKVKPQLSRFTRICRGFGLSQAPKPEVLDQLDMESRWEACLRGKFEGTWQGGPFDLERFPQPKAAALVPK